MIGIENVNEFYTNHYLAAIIGGDIKPQLDRWREAAQDGKTVTPWRRLAQLQQDFFRFKEGLERTRSAADRVQAHRLIASQLLEALGYQTRPLHRDIEAGPLPLLGELVRGDGEPLLWLLPAPAGFEEEADVLSRRLLKEAHGIVHELPLDFDPKRVHRHSVEELVTDAFQIEDPPRFVLILGDTEWVLADRGKWPEQRLLRFDLDEILGRRDAETLEAVTALLHRDSLAPESGTSLVDTLDDSSHKHAYEVSEDLKYALQASIEAIGNEAIRYRREVSKQQGLRRGDRRPAPGCRVHPLHVPHPVPALHRGAARAGLRAHGLGGLPAGLQLRAAAGAGDAGAGDGRGAQRLHHRPVAEAAVPDGVRGRLAPEGPADVPRP